MRLRVREAKDEVKSKRSKKLVGLFLLEQSGTMGWMDGGRFNTSSTDTKFLKFRPLLTEGGNIP